MLTNQGNSHQTANPKSRHLIGWQGYTYLWGCESSAVIHLNSCYQYIILSCLLAVPASSACWCHQGKKETPHPFSWLLVTRRFWCNENHSNPFKPPTVNTWIKLDTKMNIYPFKILMKHSMKLDIPTDSIFMKQVQSTQKLPGWLFKQVGIMDWYPRSWSLEFHEDLSWVGRDKGSYSKWLLQGW